jgi:proteic killer suppression protein
MIKSFKCKETEKLFDSEKSLKLPNKIQKKARIKLESLNAATSLNDLCIPPSNHLELLQG